MELNDTVAAMCSSNYKERFLAEYHQCKIRHEKLDQMLVKLDAGVLEFTPNCSKNILLDQERCMREYIHILEVRALIEGINLDQSIIPDTPSNNIPRYVHG